MAERFRGAKAFPTGFDFKLNPERLDMLHKWRKPREVFVNPMSDLGYEKIPDDFIIKIMKVIEETPRHTYRVLTKRPERLLQFLTDVYKKPCPNNLWIGVTVENIDCIG